PSATLHPSNPILSLSLHDALPIFEAVGMGRHLILVLRDHHLRSAEAQRIFLLVRRGGEEHYFGAHGVGDLHRHVAQSAKTDHPEDRKSTRLNSSHVKISYAVFCLK